MSLCATKIQQIVLIALAFCLCTAAAAAEDPWLLQSSGSNASLRGVSGVSDKCCWASGSKGTVLRTVDGGENWASVGPDGAEAADFRDIHALDESSAVIMSAGDVDRLYRTDNGGESWDLVFEETNPAAFFDGIAFDSTGTNGWLMGDPVDGRVYLLRTADSGRSWQRNAAESSPKVHSGIAAFAASGTHLTICDRGEVLIGLGGTADSTDKANDFTASILRTADDGKSWQQVAVPIASNASSGVFSICEISGSERQVIAVGGDYQQLDKNDNNIAISDDAGKSWRIPTGTRPSGFRSVVVHLPSVEHPGQIVAAGPSGTDQSVDRGGSWSRISNEGFHSMSVTRDGKLWATGSNGRVARWRQ